MENVKKQVKRLTYTTKSLEEKAKNIDRCNREGDYDTDRPWEELILGLLELRKQVDALLALHGWKEIDMKPQPCNMFDVADGEAWAKKLGEHMYDVVRDAIYMEQFFDCIERADEEALAEKLTEIITVCTSWIDALGYDEAKRGELQRRVNEKNRERGYF